MIPSLDAHLCNELGFRADVRRLPITALGCSGGAAALARAHDFLVGFPEARALVVAVELPSLSIQRTDLSLANLVSTALFGDGAAAAVLEGGLRGDARPRGRGCASSRPWRICFPRSTYALGFDLQDDGFHSVLSKDVPGLIKSGDRAPGADAGGTARADAREALLLRAPPGRAEDPGLHRRGAGAHGATTPQPSWEILRDFGNQSSASVLFVLHEWLTKRHPAGGRLRDPGRLRPRPLDRDAALQWS